MLRLTNICNDPWSLGKFDQDADKITAFLDRNGLDGLELILWHGTEENIVPQARVVSMHLSFWPVWLDFWRGNEAELLRQFGDVEAYRTYYNAATKAQFVENYRRDLLEAEAMGVKYVVFHVSHVELEHCFNYQYTYTDDEVADAFVELANEIFTGLDVHFMVLMENHWFPGLTFLNPGLANKLMDGIHYPSKGFVLDTGHLMNTNPNLADEEEAVDYMLGVLAGLDGNIRSAIRGMHLNGALTGEYVHSAAAKSVYDPADSLDDVLRKAMHHVCQIDRHVPFTHPAIRRVIDAVQPEFVVYELSTNTLEQLEQAITQQNRALGFAAP